MCNQSVGTLECVMRSKSPTLYSGVVAKGYLRYGKYEKIASERVCTYYYDLGPLVLNECDYVTLCWWCSVHGGDGCRQAGPLRVTTATHVMRYLPYPKRQGLACFSLSLG